MLARLRYRYDNGMVPVLKQGDVLPIRIELVLVLSSCVLSGSLCLVAVSALRSMLQEIQSCPEALFRFTCERASPYSNRLNGALMPSELSDGRGV